MQKFFFCNGTHRKLYNNDPKLHFELFKKFIRLNVEIIYSAQMILLNKFKKKNVNSFNKMLMSLCYFGLSKGICEINKICKKYY